MRQSIQRAVQKRSIIAVPVHVQQLSKVSANATRELYLELGRPPLLTELSARVGATHKQPALPAYALNALDVLYISLTCGV